jgi:hypothetical protein
MPFGMRAAKVSRFPPGGTVTPSRLKLQMRVRECVSRIIPVITYAWVLQGFGIE